MFFEYKVFFLNLIKLLTLLTSFKLFFRSKMIKQHFYNHKNYSLNKQHHVLFQQPLFSAIFPHEHFNQPVLLRLKVPFHGAHEIVHAIRRSPLQVRTVGFMDAENRQLGVRLAVAASFELFLAGTFCAKLFLAGTFQAESFLAGTFHAKLFLAGTFHADKIVQFVAPHRPHAYEAGNFSNDVIITFVDVIARHVTPFYAAAVFFWYRVAKTGFRFTTFMAAAVLCCLAGQHLRFCTNLSARDLANGVF